MPEYKIEILTPAAGDIEKIAAYHLKMAGSGSAKKITNELLDTIQTLKEQPYLGMKHPDPILHKREYRKLICGDYICVYKLIEKTIYIYRVVHGATDYPKLFL